jgi:hypothetical protein
MASRLRVVQHWEHRDGFRATVCAATGRLPFPRSPIESPIYPTVDGAVQWCIDIMEDNVCPMGPFAKALIERYSGPVSVMEIE